MVSLTAKEALIRMRDGRLSPRELCERCLQRARTLSELNIFITPTETTALEHAVKTGNRLQDKTTRPALNLDGIPVAFKDNFCTAGIQTTCASNILNNFVPPYNATMVQRMLDSGTVMLGKTNMDEFAMGSGSIDSIVGPVKNPWTLLYRNYRQRFKSPEGVCCRQKGVECDKTMLGARKRNIHTDVAELVQSEALSLPTFVDDSDWLVTGGSSGGSAAAVASGIVLAAFGSDTGGSTRNPASYCGVVGLKPTYGLLSRHGLIPLVNSMDVPGILTKTVEDAALVLNAVAGHDWRDSTTVTDPFQPVVLDENFSLSGLHVGIPKEYHAPGTLPAVVDVWRQAADFLERGGAKVTQVSLPHTQHSITCYHVLCCCEVASNMARYDGIEFGHRANQEESTEELFAMTRHEGFNDVVRGRILAGNFFLLRKNYERFFLKAQKVRRLISNDFKKVFSEGVDVLLTPTTLSDAPTYSWFTEQDSRARSEQQDVFTQPVNMAAGCLMSSPLTKPPC